MTTNPEIIKLIIDERRFDIPLTTLTRHPETMLGRMFQNADQVNSLTRNGSDEYELSLGIPADIFDVTLGFYYHDIIYCPPSLPLMDIRDACDYLMIPFDSSTIRCDNLADLLHEWSNNGARARFDAFLSTKLIKALLNCSERGEREGHVAILRESDFVEMEEDERPSGHHVEVIHDTDMSKFFKYGDNRIVAKQVLEMRGFKKVKISHEDHPTTRDRIRTYPSRRAEVLYNYVQRPFVHVSWERDDSRTRHVDFQCVRSRSVASLTEANADPPSAIRAQIINNRDYENVIFVDETDLLEYRRTSAGSSRESLDDRDL